MTGMVRARKMTGMVPGNGMSMLQKSNTPSLIYQYSNIALRISGQTSIFGVVYPSLFRELREERNFKSYNFIPKASEHARILISRAWPIRGKKNCKRLTKVSDCRESIRKQILLSCREKSNDFVLCLHCLVLWKLRTLETRVNSRMACKMLGEK